MTRKHPTIRREGVSTRAVVWGTRGGGSKTEELRVQDFWDRYHRGGYPSSTGLPTAITPPSKYYQQHSRGARPQVPGRNSGQNQGRPARRWLDTVGGGRPVKVYCRRRDGHPRHRVEPEGRRGKERARARIHGRWGGVGALFSRAIRREYRDLIWRAGGGDTGHMGVSNVAVLQKDLAK